MKIGKIASFLRSRQVIELLKVLIVRALVLLIERGVLTDTQGLKVVVALVGDLRLHAEDRGDADI